MHPDPIGCAVRLRRLTIENARVVLADILRQQDTAERELADAERAIRDGLAHATDPSSDDAAVEALAAWLPGARGRAHAAQGALDHAVAQASQARTVVALARSALQASEPRLAAQHPPVLPPIPCRQPAAPSTAGAPDIPAP